MPAVTAVHTNQPVNPPLDYTHQAIIDRLRQQATNGPAYIQHSATKALARTIGLFEIGRLSGRHAFEVARDVAEKLFDKVSGQAEPAAEKIKTGYERIVEIQNGAELTPEEIADAEAYFSVGTEEEDEDHDTDQEAEPP